MDLLELMKERRSHGVQYFSYPGYTFEYFRDHNITEYEAPAEIDLDEWIDLKIDAEGEKASFLSTAKKFLK